MILQKTSDLDYIPQRIVSLVPSQTELLFELGLKNETAGITKFCIHPAGWLKTKINIGGTKTVNIEKILQLQPDLIIANKEENVREQLLQLALDYPVWVTDVKDFNGAMDMIKDLGELTGKTNAAANLIKLINTQFNNIKRLSKPIPAAYLIWRKPYMAAGGDTFIHDMLLRIGFVNIFAYKIRYPVIDIEALLAANCKLLLLSSEPYPFKKKHLDELSMLLPETKIMLVDGEMFSWYGSRLIQAAKYFNELTAEITVSP